MKPFLVFISIACMTFELKAQRLVKDLVPGPSYNYITIMGNTQKGLIFNVYNSDFGTEPWISDGTAVGTKLLKDIIPGNRSSLLSTLSMSNDTIVYFHAYKDGNPSSYVYLWRTDGTPQGTFVIDTFGMNWMNIYSQQGTFHKGEYYYMKRKQYITTLCATNGTIAGTRNIFSFKDTNAQINSKLTVFKDNIYFFETDEQHGAELWSSDGTTAGTRLYFDLYTGRNSSYDYNGNGDLIPCRDKLFFIARRDPKEGYELFYISSQTGGPWLFNDYTPQIGYSSALYLKKGNDSFFFINTLNQPSEAYVSDGNWTNTRKFHNIHTNDSFNFSQCYGIHKINQKTFVSSFAPGMGLELFKTDDSLNNNGLLLDINPGGGSGINENLQFAFSDTRVFFMANNFMLGTDIWVSDGTTDSTQLYLELLGMDFNSSYTIHQWNNRIFFVGNLDANIGSELYELTLNKNLGIAEHDLSANAPYPNPIRAGEQLHVPESCTQLKLYNTLGQLVWQTELENGKCQVPEHLSAGLYHLFLDNNNTPVKIILE